MGECRREKRAADTAADFQASALWRRGHCGGKQQRIGVDAVANRWLGDAKPPREQPVNRFSRHSNTSRPQACRRRATLGASIAAPYCPRTHA